MTYAVIRVRGGVHIKPQIVSTLKMLKLHRHNHCVIVPKTQAYEGMLRKVKDYVTWGEIDKETLTKLITYRGRLVGNKPLSDEYLKSSSKYSSINALAEGIIKGEVQYKEIKDIKSVIRLPPPISGYEGIKRAYAAGGALGYRGHEINKLIVRMLTLDIKRHEKLEPKKRKEKEELPVLKEKKKVKKVKKMVAKKEKED